MTIGLLVDLGVHNELWAGSIITAYYCTINPSKSVRGSTPEEVWFIRPYPINHLKILGYKAYAHVDEIQQERKLGND